MTYKEFYDTYAWLSKKYPDTSVFCGHEEKDIKMVETEYEKGGSKWKLISTNTEMVNGEYYCNVFDAVPWFRNLGGYEKVELAYTRLGYVPVKNVSISPDRKRKIVREYYFK